jgi:thiol-disulfide isomerase/thioredoxin
MIRVSTTAELFSKIELHKPGWLNDARARTDALAAGAGDPKLPSIWSDIKKVYMDLQASKCVYCEKELENQAIEQDVEHYRPKKKVARWALPKALAHEGIALQQPAQGSEPGYTLLAYHALNYAAACKTCNSILKKNLFPIAGSRDSTARDPASIVLERPYLLYPIGQIDEDPEDLIEFAGLSPQAKAAGFRRKRALVTIWLFQLNRKWLQKDRALEIMRYYLALERSTRVPRDQVVVSAEIVVRYMSSARARHANCLRSYRRLYEADRAAAERIFHNCARLMGTYSS